MLNSRLLKITLACIAFIGFADNRVIAQCTEFWGVTTDNNSSGVGTIFKTDCNGDNLQTLYNWQINEGSGPCPALCRANNGKLYGTTRKSTKGHGSIFEWDPTNNCYITKYYFIDEKKGSEPTGFLMQASNGKLYGITYLGGENNNGEGVLYEWDPVTNTYEKKCDLKSNENGRTLSGSLIQANNGMLYGNTFGGGAYGMGVLFEYDPISNTYCKKVDFRGIIGAHPMGSLIQADNGKLYGITANGGEDSVEYSFGVLFEWDPVTNIYTIKRNFNNSKNGSRPTGSLVRSNEGKLYGMTQGGEFSHGVIFEWDPQTNIYTKKFEFNEEIDGILPIGSLMLAEDGKFYGMTTGGGEFSHGAIFRWDPITNIYTKIYDYNEFGNDDNCLKLVQADSNRFFGLTNEGGMSNQGTLFEWNNTTNIFIKRYDFYGAEYGSFPSGPFMEAPNGKLYSVTIYGGLYGCGVLFEWDPVTSKLSKKLDFYKEGYNPVSPLMLASNNKIYGTAYHGGNDHNGTLFEWDYIINQYLKKFDFTFDKGFHPYGSLAEANNKLYGMTSDGYDWRTECFFHGAIYEWDPSTDTYTTKIRFDGINGGQPNGSMILSDNGLFYGVTRYGGIYNKGVLFKWDPVTNTYIIKINFNGAENGQKPDRSMLLANNGKLYGVTSEGGVFDKGTLFEWDPLKDSLFKKIDFNDGSNPFGTLMQARNGKIYGVTYSGGTYDAGILYEWDPISETYTKKYDFKSGESGTGPTGLIEIEKNKSSIGRTIDIEECDSYISPSGKLWTNSGEYKDTIPNVFGCDSIITVNLTIHNSTTSFQNSTACNSYISPSGIIWAKTGEYLDTITNTSGCDSIIVINLTIVSIDTSITQSQSVLKANADEAAYQWIDCSNGNVPLVGDTLQTFTAKTSGNYAVIISQNGCVDTSATYQVNITNIKTDNFKNYISLYPNPNNGSFAIDLGSFYPSIEITITELDGRIIHKEQRSNSRIIEMKISAMPGIYTIIVTSENERAMFKVMKK